MVGYFRKSRRDSPSAGRRGMKHLGRRVTLRAPARDRLWSTFPQSAATSLKVRSPSTGIRRRRALARPPPRWSRLAPSTNQRDVSDSPRDVHGLILQPAGRFRAVRHINGLVIFESKSLRPLSTLRDVGHHVRFQTNHSGGSRLHGDGPRTALVADADGRRRTPRHGSEINTVTTSSPTLVPRPNE